MVGVKSVMTLNPLFDMYLIVVKAIPGPWRTHLANGPSKKLKRDVPMKQKGNWQHIHFLVFHTVLFSIKYVTERLIQISRVNSPLIKFWMAGLLHTIFFVLSNNTAIKTTLEFKQRKSETRMILPQQMASKYQSRMNFAKYLYLLRRIVHSNCLISICDIIF